MKLIFNLMMLFSFVGCYPHWQSPSYKLASQADNYLENERAIFL